MLSTRGKDSKLADLRNRLYVLPANQFTKWNQQMAAINHFQLKDAVWLVLTKKDFDHKTSTI